VFSHFPAFLLLISTTAFIEKNTYRLFQKGSLALKKSSTPLSPF
jgi:hypothetical protein